MAATTAGTMVATTAATTEAIMVVAEAEATAAAKEVAEVAATAVAAMDSMADSSNNLAMVAAVKRTTVATEVDTTECMDWIGLDWIGEKV